MDLENVSGIYCYTNILDDKKYIGKSINLKKRLYTHEYNFKQNSLQRGENAHLWNAVKKYGRENFVLEILETCASDDVNFLETKYILFFETLGEKGYNFTKGGNGISGFKFSEESKNHLSEIRKGENNVNYGRNISEEYGDKISKTRKERGSSRLENNPRFGEKSETAASKYHGVTRQLPKNKSPRWMARVYTGTDRIFIKTSLSEEVAAKAYDKYVVDHNLPNPLNFPK